MRRRSFLAISLSALCAGCTGSGTASELPKSVTVTGSDSLSKDAGIAVTAEIENRTVTEDDPAVVRVTIANQSDEEKTVYSGSVPVFADAVSTSDDGNRVILRSDTPGIDELDRVAADCWQWDHDHVSTGAGVWNKDIDPGGSVSEEFILFGHPTNSDPCLPSGEYKFEDSYRVRHGESEQELTWGFQIRIQN